MAREDSGTAARARRWPPEWPSTGASCRNNLHAFRANADCRNLSVSVSVCPSLSASVSSRCCVTVPGSTFAVVVVAAYRLMPGFQHYVTYVPQCLALWLLQLPLLWVLCLSVSVNTPFARTRFPIWYQLSVVVPCKLPLNGYCVVVVVVILQCNLEYFFVSLVVRNVKCSSYKI